MKILQNEPLSKHTTFHLGGNAKYFCFIEKMDELEEALRFVKEKSLPYFVLGGGSNVVAGDKGYRGVIIKLPVESFKVKDKFIECDAGVSLAKIVDESLRNSLIGLEWAYGIPGTIGGAVRGNAGAYGGEMKDSIESVKVFRSGKIVELTNKDCTFGYRESIFKNNDDIIIYAKIKLKIASEKDLTDAKEKKEKIKKERADKFNDGFSAGSFFKNVLMVDAEIKKFKKKFPDLPDQFVEYKKIPAAWLIEQCGLKGFCVGNICVSEKHAGILINNGKGICDELHQLVSLIKTRVSNKFGIELHEEIEYII